MLDLLPQGASCQYNAASVSGVPLWVAATIEDLGADGKSYCIVVSETAVKSQAQIESLRAPSSGSTWERGTAVEYESNSTGLWLPAVVICFNTNSKTYSLDVHEHALPERIRPRMKHRSEYNRDYLHGRRPGKHRESKPLNLRGSAPLVESCHSSASHATSVVSVASLLESHKTGCHCCGVAGKLSARWFSGWLPWYACFGSKAEDLPIEVKLEIHPHKLQREGTFVEDIKGPPTSNVKEPLDSLKSPAPDASVSNATRLRLPSIESSRDWAPLPQETVCLVDASSEIEEAAWERASIKWFNKDDQTYDVVKLDSGVIEVGVSAKRIRAQATDVPWQPGTAVEYESASLRVWLPASIVCINKNKKTYKLNIRESAEPARIRPRSSLGASPVSNAGHTLVEL